MWPLPERGWRVLALLMAPVATQPHAGMGYGLAPAREGDRVWQPFRIPTSGSEAHPLPRSPKALELGHQEV